MLQKFSISSKCCSFELYIHQRILKNQCFPLHKNIVHENDFWRIMWHWRLE